MLNQGCSGSLLTPVVPSSCPLITPVAVTLVNKNRRRWLERKTKRDEESEEETVSHMSTGMKLTDTQNTTEGVKLLPVKQIVPLSPGSHSCR